MRNIAFFLSLVGCASSPPLDNPPPDATPDAPADAAPLPPPPPTDDDITIAPDSCEDNDDVGHATYLGNLNDAYDAFQWIRDLSIDSAADEDWFRFHVTDGFDAGNPDATIAMANLSAHELSVWFKCDTADYASDVRCAEWFGDAAATTLSDPALGTGCMISAGYLVWAAVSPSCWGIADSGTVTVRIRKRAPPGGDLYDLRVGVE